MKLWQDFGTASFGSYDIKLLWLYSKSGTIVFVIIEALEVGPTIREDRWLVQACWTL